MTMLTGDVGRSDQRGQIIGGLGGAVAETLAEQILAAHRTRHRA